MQPEEVDALSSRYNKAIERSQKAGSHTVLVQFQAALKMSKAVLCRSLNRLASLVSDDNQLYVSYYKDVESGSRLPEENTWDRGRESADGLVFPHYHKEICFGALSLNERGPNGYGSQCIVLRSNLIRLRASVFEENSFGFVVKRGLNAGDSLPPGYRAQWDNRDQLSIAKLGDKITSSTQPDDFASLLMDQSSRENADFIEVHVYGSIHRRNIEKVVSQKLTKKADQALAASIKRKLRDVNASYEFKYWMLISRVRHRSPCSCKKGNTTPFIWNTLTIPSNARTGASLICLRIAQTSK